MGGHRAEEDTLCKTVRHKKESWRSAGVVTIVFLPPVIHPASSSIFE
jgi:hypothetical protein